MSRSWRAVGVGVLLALTMGCAGPMSPPAPVVAPSITAQEPGTAPTTSPAQQAVDAGDATVTRDGVEVGIAVLDRRTGTLATNDAGASPFNSASLSKVLTVVDALTNGDEVTDDDRQLMQAALGPSDDDAMNTLWSTSGGSSGITRIVDGLGLQDTTVPDDASQWGEVQLSPRDMASVLRFVVEGLAPADRDFVLTAMSAAPARATDGFDQAFGLLDPERRGPAAAKQGWLCCLDDSVDLHSAGLPDEAGRFVVAIFSQQPFGYPAARSVLDDASAAVRDVLGA
ncbi:serine hydrolase [Actinomycetospora atypica]|uniref:Serine hydrolase n=1 Tax=Actinomycetospora atypica TaxID=1290095 RepID=A0ABV9YJ15_9PSEU